MTDTLRTPAPAPPRNQRSGHGWLAFLILIVATILGVVQFVTNPATPVGHTGYLVEEPRFFGVGGHRGLQKGPASHGATLQRLRVVNVDTRPRPFHEIVEVLDGSRKFRVTVHAIVQVDENGVQHYVEALGASDDWYQAWVRPTLLHEITSLVQENISGRELRLTAEMIGEQVAVEMQAALSRASLPFLVNSIQVSALDLPSGFRIQPTTASRALAKSDGDPLQGFTQTAIEIEITSALDETDPYEPGKPRDSLVEISHRRELRGAWLSTASNVDWPSRAELSTEKQKEELVEYLDTMVDLRMNALFFQVRSGADAIFPSELEPWSAVLTGEQGKAPEPFYDPLAFAIEECHKRSIELHAWINPYRADPHDERFELSSTHVAYTMPRYVYDYGKVKWMDPGAKQVQEWILGVISDLVDRYDIDGIHFDDYFYPYPKPGLKFPDSATYEDYCECCGELDLEDWRRMNVDTLIRRTSEEVHAAKPWVKFGVSPFGIYRNDEPEGVKGLDQYTTLYSDPKKWLEKGWVDYIAPQLYWKSSSKYRPYEKLLNWWGEQNALRRHIYAGISLASIERRNGNWSVAEFEKQFNFSREASHRQSLGNIVFGMRVFNGQKAEKARDMFKDKIYPEKALPPAMPWMHGKLPAAPRNLRTNGDELRWDAVDATSTESSAPAKWLRYWAIYDRTEDNQWNLLDVVPCTTTRYATGPGTYAVSAVDRAGQESAGAVTEIAPPIPVNPRTVIEIEEDAAQADAES